MADVTIRGAGIFGLSIAWECVKRGAQVRIVDPNGAAAGASGGIVGALAPHVPENWNTKKQFQLESLLMAERFWQDVHTQSNVDPGYARTGRIQPIRDESALTLAIERAQSASALWGNAADWNVIDNALGWALESPTGMFIHDTLSARIHPKRACIALQSALEVHGVTVEPDAPDQGKNVWATGVHGLEALNKGRSRLVGAGVKGQAALFQLNASLAPQVFVDGLHIIPHLDDTVALGSTTERDYAHSSETDEQLERLIDTARDVIPELQGASVIFRWAGVRPRSRSRAPMLGKWPDRPNHFIANGGFKIGFGMAPKVAEVMADLVLEGTDHIPQGFGVEDNL